MMNSEKYRFSDFTLAKYDDLLRIISGLTCIPYDLEQIAPGTILWRHDVDLDLEQALKIAKRESKAGVKSTYFLLPGCEFYNLREKGSYSIVKEILSLGHDIGLHFDPHFYDIESEADLETPLESEKRFLEELFKTEIKAFSFHITSPLIMSFQAERYGGMVNTYSTLFQKEIPYCSDSNGIWRHERIEDFIEGHINGPLQILTHPIWWTRQVNSPRRKVIELIERQAATKFENYEEMIRATGRKLIDD